MKKLTMISLLIAGLALGSLGVWAQAPDESMPGTEKTIVPDAFEPAPWLANPQAPGRRGRRSFKRARRPMVGQRGLMARGTAMRRSGRGGNLGFLLANQERFNITDEQVEMIRSLHLQIEEIRVKQQNAGNEHRLAMKKLMLDREGRDYSRLEASLKRMSDSRHQSLIESMKIRDQIQDVLTPEQRDAIRKAAKDRLSRRSGIRGRMERSLRDTPRLRERIR